MPGARIEVREGRNRELVTWNCSFARVRVHPEVPRSFFRQILGGQAQTKSVQPRFTA
jgi:hypothetical protein